MESEISSLHAVPVKLIPPQKMLDPSSDDPDGEWCYLAKSTTVIGIPFQPDVTQVTFDGAIYTKSAELCFFFGEGFKPPLARQKTFLEGWIPVVQYDCIERGIRYSVEMFAFSLEGEDASNTVNHVRVKARNEGSKRAKGSIMAAMRHTGKDCRMGDLPMVEKRIPPMPYDETWRYEMDGNTVFRDGKLVYAFSPGCIMESVPGTAYSGSFSGKALGITEQSAVCAVRYDWDLNPGETGEAVFKMPRVPVDRIDTSFLKKLEKATYDSCRAGAVSYWKTLAASCTVFSIPEPRVNDAVMASLVHVLLGTRERNGVRFQTDGLPYPSYFLTAAPEEGGIYLVMGLPELAMKLIVERAIVQQEADGLYLDKSLSHGKIIPAAHGHILYITALTVLFTHDKTLGERVFASVSRGVDYIETTISTDEFGLLPPAAPYDNEMINGHHASNNFWALLGLRQAIRLARFLQYRKEAEDWCKLEEKYRNNILTGINASAKPDGYVPPGLYSYRTGKEACQGCSEFQTHCDWENMVLAFPTELLEPSDPRVRGTVDHIRKGYAEGVMTYRHGQHLHQYITANQILQYVAIGDSYAALKDFYHLLLHAGSTQECFENLVVPWGDRSVRESCPPPHVWASSKLGLLVRSLLLMEFGGHAGMEESSRELWLFHCLSPAWVKPGKKVSFANAPTEFGKISAEMKFNDKGATARFAAQFHSNPSAYRVRIPYFKELTAFKSNSKEARSEKDCILLSPDAKSLEIEWKDRDKAHDKTFEDILMEYRSTSLFKGVDDAGRAVVEMQKPFLLDSEKQSEPQPLSFELVLKAFRHEYARRVEECRCLGGEIATVNAPPLFPNNLTKPI